MQTILTVTLNPALDLATSVEHMTPGRKLRCHGARLDPGGGGVNVSRVIRRFGGRSTVFAALGGPTGRTLLELMRKDGLDVIAFPVRGDTRQDITIDEAARKRQFRLVLPGPRWSRQEARAALVEIERLAAEHEIVVASGSLPPGVPEDFYAKLAHIVRRQGGRFVIDTSGAPLEHALEAGVFLAKPNHVEFAELAGAKRADWRGMALVGRRLRERGQAEAIIVTRGAKGALAILPDGAWRLQAPKVTVASMVGAGDSLIGAAIVSLARNKSLLEAARIGVAAAAAAVGAEGTELAHRTETLRLARRTKAWKVAMG